MLALRFAERNAQLLCKLDRINQFFDGKRTDDEIMFLAEITRRQLREVLQQYDDFVSFLIELLCDVTDSCEQLLTALHPA